MWLVTARGRDRDIQGRLLIYCDPCRASLHERVASAIPLEIVEIDPHLVMSALYEKGFTTTKPGTAAKHLGLSSSRSARQIGSTAGGGYKSMVWDGVLDRSALADWYLADRDCLAESARAGDWPKVLDLLRGEAQLSPNHWRLGGSSWFTPLHQAAWHGAPISVVEDLYGLGALCGQKTADGRTARQIAESRGHDELLDALSPPSSSLQDPEFAGPLLERNLAQLVESRIRPQLSVSMRPLPIEVIEAAPSGTHVWYPVPGMYGGFDVRLEHDYLIVDSWSRVAGGSGQSHAVTTQGVHLLAEGYV